MTFIITQISTNRQHVLTGALVFDSLGTGSAADTDDGTDLRSLGLSSILRYREKNSSNHPKNSSLSSRLRFAQSILSCDNSRWLGGYPLATRVGGGGGE